MGLCVGGWGCGVGGWVTLRFWLACIFVCMGVGAKIGKIQQSWVNIGLRLQQISLSNFIFGWVGGLAGWVGGWIKLD